MATTVQPTAGETTKQLVNYHVDAGVAVIEMNDPPANTYTYEMNRELDEAILNGDGGKPSARPALASPAHPLLRGMPP